jgi:Flp pilus assembly pilin Flp
MPAWGEIMELIRNLWQDESGDTAMEYVLLVALIAAVILGLENVLGQVISNIFTSGSRAFMQTISP